MAVVEVARSGDVASLQSDTRGLQKGGGSAAPLPDSASSVPAALGHLFQPPAGAGRDLSRCGDSLVRERGKALTRHRLRCASALDLEAVGHLPGGW
jgi:hypothetical protein